MGQVIVYLDDETESTARAAAESHGLSLSTWIARRIQKRARTEWPVAVRELAGACPDFPCKGKVGDSSPLGGRAWGRLGIMSGAASHPRSVLVYAELRGQCPEPLCLSWIV